MESLDHHISGETVLKQSDDSVKSSHIICDAASASDASVAQTGLKNVTIEQSVESIHMPISKLSNPEAHVESLNTTLDTEETSPLNKTVNQQSFDSYSCAEDISPTSADQQSPIFTKNATNSSLAGTSSDDIDIGQKRRKSKSGKHKKKVPSLSAQELKDMGNRHKQTGNYQEALNCYTEALRLDPESHILYSNRAAMHLYLDNDMEALEDATKCLDLCPKFVKGYGRKTTALMKTGRWEEAASCCRESLKLDSHNSFIVDQLLQCCNRVLFNKLVGLWIGNLPPIMGGMEHAFKWIQNNPNQMVTTTLGRETTALFKLDATKDPVHIDITPLGPNGEAIGCFPYIIRFVNDNELHVSAPHTPTDRPTNFNGPSSFIMKRSTLTAEEREKEALDLEVLKKSEKEQIECYLKDAASILPASRIEEASSTDTQEEMQMKVALALDTQSRLFQLDRRYLYDVSDRVRRWLEAGPSRWSALSKNDGKDSYLKDSNVKDLLKLLYTKTITCGLISDDGEAENLDEFFNETEEVVVKKLQSRGWLNAIRKKRYEIVTVLGIVTAVATIASLIYIRKSNQRSVVQ
eukprot:GHVL01044913.1.p1 GENE.GHVL01044913.1~~GHVL01044913.1.p1  ORF type:complete len:578 (+),score=97.34 GHVL01044913.1:21-1754(+)